MTTRSLSTISPSSGVISTRPSAASPGSTRMNLVAPPGSVAVPEHLYDLHQLVVVVGGGVVRTDIHEVHPPAVRRRPRHPVDGDPVTYHHHDQPPQTSVGPDQPHFDFHHFLVARLDRTVDLHPIRDIRPFNFNPNLMGTGLPELLPELPDPGIDPARRGPRPVRQACLDLSQVVSARVGPIDHAVLGRACVDAVQPGIGHQEAGAVVPVTESRDEHVDQ